MNILFFNRSFYPDTEATGQYLTELCEDLAKIGHNITVVCGKSYHIQVERKNLILQKEKYKSIDIIRARGTTLPKSFLIFRLINLGFYFLVAFFGGFLVTNKPHIVVAQTDPPLLGLLGIFFSRWYKAKFIYSCKDIYPEIGIITGKLKNPFLNFLLEIINRLSYRFADKIIVLGEDMKELLVKKGVSENKIIVIHDWADTETLYPIPENENPQISKFKSAGDFVVMYSGNIGLTQNLEKIIEVATHFSLNKKIKFVIIGEGANKKNLQDLANKLGLSNVRFLPYQPKDELKYSLNVSDIQLITLEKGLKGVMVPSKIYGILACGKPFIALVDKDSEVDFITRKFNCGITLLPGDTKGIEEAIKWCIQSPDELNKMGNNGRKAAVELFNRKTSTEKFNKTLLDVLS